MRTQTRRLEKLVRSIKHVTGDISGRVLEDQREGAAKISCGQMAQLFLVGPCVTLG